MFKKNRIYPKEIDQKFGEITSIFSPIVEYIGLVISDSDIKLEGSLTDDQVASIYNIIIKLNEIVIMKCKKQDINIHNVETLMDYTDVLCDMLMENSTTSNLYQIMTKVNQYFTDQGGEEDLDNSEHEMERQRWNIIYTFLGEKTRLATPDAS